MRSSFVSAISGMAVLFVGMLYAEQMPPLPEGAFSFAVIPDTQGYDGEGRTTKGGRSPGVGPTRNPKLDATVNWLLANRKKENIRFVTHTGDITDMNNDFQWRFCSNAMARLDGKLPYSVVPGNHDMKSNGDTTLFQRYFPASRYEQNSWYAGHFSGYTNSAGVFVSGDNANSCCLFENGDEKFVVLNIECNAPDPVLKWGGEMLSRYRDRHAIIATHQDIGAIKAKDKRKIYEETRSLSKKELLIIAGEPGHDRGKNFVARADQFIHVDLNKIDLFSVFGDKGLDGFDVGTAVGHKFGQRFDGLRDNQYQEKINHQKQKQNRRNAGNMYAQLFAFEFFQKPVFHKTRKRP